MNMLSLENELKANAYPGRGIVIGKSPDGSKAVCAYFIMGRSANSRNRIFVKDLRSRQSVGQQDNRYQRRPDRYHL